MKLKQSSMINKIHRSVRGMITEVKQLKRNKINLFSKFQSHNNNFFFQIYLPSIKRQKTKRNSGKKASIKDKSENLQNNEKYLSKNTQNQQQTQQSQNHNRTKTLDYLNQNNSFLKMYEDELLDLKDHNKNYNKNIVNQENMQRTQTPKQDHRCQLPKIQHSKKTIQNSHLYLSIDQNRRSNSKRDKINYNLFNTIDQIILIDIKDQRRKMMDKHKKRSHSQYQMRQIIENQNYGPWRNNDERQDLF